MTRNQIITCILQEHGFKYNRFYKIWKSYREDDEETYKMEISHGMLKIIKVPHLLSLISQILYRGRG